MKPDTTIPCPSCGRTVPHGNGMTRDGARFHFWCAVDDKPPLPEGETRLKSGAYV